MYNEIKYVYFSFVLANLIKFIHFLISLSVCSYMYVPVDLVASLLSLSFFVLLSVYHTTEINHTIVLIVIVISFAYR